jgi:hypothetical protein
LESQICPPSFIRIFELLLSKIKDDARESFVKHGVRVIQELSEYVKFFIIDGELLIKSLDDDMAFDIAKGIFRISIFGRGGIFPKFF